MNLKEIQTAVELLWEKEGGKTTPFRNRTPRQGELANLLSAVRNAVEEDFTRAELEELRNRIQALILDEASAGKHDKITK